MKTLIPEQAQPTKTSPKEQTTLSLPRRLLRLAVALGVLWLIIYVLAPLPVKYFGPMQNYARVVDRMGITPGALFYNDVDQSLDAETNNRDAIRFFVNKEK